MEELIKLYLLEQPRSISDMIRDLTEKELSSAAAIRSKEIPRIAGNWFKEDTGYIWTLREAGVINDVGRQYALDKDWLIEGLLADLNIKDRFPQHAERGDVAKLEPAYTQFMEEYTFGAFKQELREHLFSGDLMAAVFAFDAWQDAVTLPETDGRRITLYRPVFRFWSFVHIALLSSIVVSRRAQLTDRMADRDRYFTWKNRRERLRETENAFVRRTVHRCFPWAEQAADGGFVDDRVERIASAFGSIGGNLPAATVDFLGDVYLLSFDDGAGLFEQRREEDADVHLFLNLLERGVLLPERDLERDPTTGDFIVPVSDMQSYLDQLVGLVDATDALQAPHES